LFNTNQSTGGIKMPNNARRIAFAALGAALAIAANNLLAEEAGKAQEAPEAVIVGNPPADHPFGKLKIGMTYDEAIAIVGKPSSEDSWCTGKQHIPFYFGDDRGRAEANFKGMGKLDFNADIRQLLSHLQGRRTDQAGVYRVQPGRHWRAGKISYG
jgi:hypothetical protein